MRACVCARVGACVRMCVRACACVHVCVYSCAHVCLCVLCVQMSQHDCSVLLQCYVELKNSINVEDHVLDYLYSKSVISKSLRDRIRHDCTTADSMVYCKYLQMCSLVVRSPGS